MGSESAPSSGASIISIDPAVASHITGTTQVSSVPSYSRTGSYPAQRLKTPESVSSRDHARNQSVPVATDKKRSNSLRRAKNSTEVLRQRSTRSTKKAKQLETIPDTREGRNFTIGNVGTGGVLYLKPSAHQNASLQTSPPVLMPLTAPADLPSIPHSDENIRPLTKMVTRSDSPSTAIRSASPKQSFTKPSRRPTIETVRSRHGRSQSFSTVEEHRPSYTGTRSKTLKIVINRPETANAKPSLVAAARDAPQLSLPTLEVPIPHYRIGTPRFSDQGTPMLRNSAFSRTSASLSDRSDAAIQPKPLASGPPPASARAFARLGTYQARAETGEDIKTRPKTTDSAKTDSTVREPIQPEIYDALAEVYDDPSVVRYAQNVREITAATPARIIAQISSESFMDYELVSDFFLTFRSFMSTYTVLDLLLARLRWAIDRQEDDGRIIRVRTFAALRHWILNYFMDDFMPDRKLRARFCSEINRMYHDVEARRNRGTSDLKVLRDLKRCWNGRCSMYWDPTDFSLDGDQDDDLHPGGLDDLELIHKPEIVEELHVPERRTKTYSNSSWFEIPPAVIARAQQERLPAGAKSNSVGSDHSLQAKSCTIPRNLLRGSPSTTFQDGGSHPIPVQLRREGAPSNLQVKTTGHRRGAASIDSDREPTPRNASMTSLQLFQGASIVRGSMFGPSAPFVQIVSSPSTPEIAKFETNNLQSHNIHRGGSPTSAHAPGVKNIFGSLRKALAGRHGHSDMALVTVSSPIPIRNDQPVQRSQMPLNMSRSHDELRSKAQVNSHKPQVRIDLLCAQVSQSYDKLFPNMKRSDLAAKSAHPIVMQSPARAKPVDPVLLTPDLRKDRLPSHATRQSGSIVIVNDTGVSMPTMSGGLHSYSHSSLPQEQYAEYHVLEALQKLHFGLGIDQRSSVVPANTQRSSDALGEVIDSHEATFSQPDSSAQVMSAVALPSEHRKPTSPHLQATAGSSPTIRRRSDESSIERRAAEPSSDATATSVSAYDNEDGDAASITQIPAHSLRRRPGGDLRKVENVQELDHAVHHESLATTTTQSGSPIHSITLNEDGSRVRRTKSAEPPTKKTVSMINTHSSQHLRPSFEAAVADFSRIPDDADGGLEATLLKLEGRYDQRSPPLEQHPLDAAQRRRSMPEMSSIQVLGDDQSTVEASGIGQDYVHVENPDKHVREDAGQVGDPADAASSRKSSIYGLPMGSVDGSENSFDARPPLQRDTISGPVSQSSAGKIMPSPLHLQKGFQNRNASGDEMNRQLELRQSLQRPLTAAESNQSFLLDEDENLSDLSSEISVDIINYTHGADLSVSPMLAAPGTALSGLEIPSHPLTYASVVNLAPATERERESMTIRDSQLMQHGYGKSAGTGARPVPTPDASRTSVGPAHIPFILACDSQVLAQQLTLIEKSALAEIDWSDLVERRWESNPYKVLDWAEFLAMGDIHGVDLVVTRFNLMSKWVRSEIVLTQDIEERAQVIAKFIHAAAHARRLHNYATMVQITVGLTSTDCTRLTKTWEKVPGPDRSLLKNMERLVQPIRNFHELREEIESADFSDGCIPFLGLYVRDLTYNAQKPAQISSRRGSEPLINFERFRKSAVIVKGLLRLIDASARYAFEPQKGIIERCLWLATLSEDKIYRLSRSLEH